MPIKPIDLSRTPKIIENNLNRIAAYEENINNNLTKLKHLEKIISIKLKNLFKNLFFWMLLRHTI